jgi:protein-S-isoprenylcysteine O-methyltransferase Ste14
MSAQTKVVLTPKALVQVILVVFVAPLIPLVISGKWNWWEAWIYAVFSSLAFIISRVLVARHHPDLIAERARFMEAKDTKPWDKILAPLLGIGSIMILVVAGLDKFYGWSPAFALEAKIIALVGIVLGYAFSSWALIENRFFSGTVRIQSERGHQVVSTGPYRIVRHPGYAGGMLGYLFIPILLDSLWAFIPAILLGVVMITRTALEDEHCRRSCRDIRIRRKTRYRLIPGIW